MKDVRKNHSINLAGLAVQAMLYEAACYPSPGLVSRVSSGAHQDMDYFTFLDSATSLIKPLICCAEAGFSSACPSDLFKRIRQIGQVGEEQMLCRTLGVNTHKGMFFLLGICCAAGGRVLFRGAPFSSLPNLIREMTSGMVARELSSRSRELKKAADATLTHGENLFLRYQVEGIRGEVERGLPTVFGFALGFYKGTKGLSQNDRLVQTLLAIMQSCEDSNILYRHGFETLREVQDQAKQVISQGGVKTSQGIKALAAMEQDFSQRKISPGGSADLLGVTVFLDLFEEYLQRTGG